MLTSLLFTYLSLPRKTNKLSRDRSHNQPRLQLIPFNNLLPHLQQPLNIPRRTHIPPSQPLPRLSRKPDDKSTTKIWRVIQICVIQRQSLLKATKVKIVQLTSLNRLNILRHPRGHASGIHRINNNPLVAILDMHKLSQAVQRNLARVVRRAGRLHEVRSNAAHVDDVDWFACFLGCGLQERQESVHEEVGTLEVDFKGAPPG
jgi:hypothetical protein